MPAGLFVVYDLVIVLSDPAPIYGICRMPTEFFHLHSLPVALKRIDGGWTMKEFIAAAFTALMMTGAASAGVPAMPSVVKKATSTDTVILAVTKPGLPKLVCPPTVRAPFCR